MDIGGYGPISILHIAAARPWTQCTSSRSSDPRTQGSFRHTRVLCTHPDALERRILDDSPACLPAEPQYPRRANEAEYYVWFASIEPATEPALDAPTRPDTCLDTSCRKESACGASRAKRTPRAATGAAYFVRREGRGQ
ncbi:uncharacterized protein TRAVEDRAFT_43819 [Trametes versicolor FP-101664 SS1]|uniref:uncharacterized protein n=1 Tax=Trametes versicolor (strain FP-101664) TaxID=717944 RepID=UPI0004623A4A|nr:uncharacterized protein TRAVEDRAFT_43819 [Trametes versicolor FP-101664 SS1]EIW63534.1 hypothetical protein TRAVEDRAFT_43819 [Trametes versicolor FP-101664 SS1]